MGVSQQVGLRLAAGWVCLALCWALAGCGGGGGQPAGVLEEAVGQESAKIDPESLGLLRAPDPEAVVAKVNGTPIRARKVYEVAQANKIRLLAEGREVTEAMEKELLRTSLDALVNAELMIQEAKRRGLEVSPEDLDRELQTAKAAFPTEEEYQKYLANAGLTEEDVRREAERRLQMQAFVQSVPTEPLQEEEARRFYEANKDLFTEGEQVRAQWILVRSRKDDPPAKREEARKRIEEARNKALAGEDFGALAREYSQAPSAARGGDLGFFGRGVMFPEFEKEAFETPVGEISEVFETPTGFNILKVLERKPARVRAFEEVKPSLMVDLTRAKEGDSLRMELERLRAEAQIEYLDPELAPVSSEEGEPETASSAQP